MKLSPRSNGLLGQFCGSMVILATLVLFPQAMRIEYFASFVVGSALLLVVSLFMDVDDGA